MIRQKGPKRFPLLIILVLSSAFSAHAAEPQQPSAEELAKKTQNPVADLISVPLQNNWNFGAGLHHNKTIYVLNVQPVIPITLSDEWNLITRIIMPIINQARLFPSFGGLVPSTAGTGFGDFNPTFFLSPAKPGGLIWGLGPTFTLNHERRQRQTSGKISRIAAIVSLRFAYRWARRLFAAANFGRGG
ncbi:MAG: hypothetical protein ACREQW_10180 [Candidatus Binatia bacterium]